MSYYNIIKGVVIALLCFVSMPSDAKKKDRKTTEQSVIVADTLMKDSLTKDSVAHAAKYLVAMEGAAWTGKDSVNLKQMEKPLKQKRDWATWKPDPKRALWLSLVIPGAGQIYNRKFWKLPIVYGGIIGCAYAMSWNNQMYMDYSQAYLDIMDDDPATKSYTQFLHLGAQIDPSNEERYKQIFKARKDKYRRWRDLSFFVMLGVYALSVIDAYVDAQLSQFDISDDLSLRIEPAVINGNSTMTNGLSNSAIGVKGALTF